MSRDGKRRRALSYEERVLWTTVTKAIAPLRARPPVAPDDAPVDDNAKLPVKPAPPAKRAAKVAPAAPSPPAVKKPPEPQPTALGRRMKQRVARGKEEIDARLDLHGMTQTRAHRMLSDFLHRAHADGLTFVLVITGKGKIGAESERGVLRRQVPQWLGLPEFRTLVVGFEEAHTGHGGAGALYVRIRRMRV